MTNLNETLEGLRANYQAAKLDIEECAQDPVEQFDSWMENAIDAHCDEPNAFVLSTVDKRGAPRARVVLLKGVHEDKFVFYTNYSSAKGEEIASNDRACLTFLWLPLQRQIRIEGKVTKVDKALSEDYFQKRPRGSQLGAMASPQSQKVASRKELETLFKDIHDKYVNIEILPRPLYWGGYAVEADYLEFWQGRPNRMHDRICYEKKGEAWEKFRLAP
jgi:pyridoxamine 5'-phosphate oxidase